MKNAFVRLALLLVCLGLVACQTQAVRQQASKLRDTLRAYDAVMRWSQFAQTIAFVAPDQREKLDTSVLGNIQVTAYETVSPPVLMDDTHASQTVGIEYVLKDSQAVRTLIDRQMWQFDEDSANWYLQSGLPAFQ